MASAAAAAEILQFAWRFSPLSPFLNSITYLAVLQMPALLAMSGMASAISRPYVHMNVT